MKIKFEDIRSIMVEVFPNSYIPQSIDGAKLNDFVEWDSLGNFNLLLTVEERYGVRFDLDEMAEIRSVPTLVETLERKLC